MTRVIHTGDTHLGYRQYHSPERRADFLAAFRQVVDDAIAEDVDAVVHAGDLFHDRRPDLRDLLGTISVLRTLRDADVPFLAIVGNHEHKRDRQWIDLFETLGLATRLDEEGQEIGETVFYGLDYVPESQREKLDYEFAFHEREHAALVAHGLFTPFVHGTWDTETVLEESSVDFDAMLLGDNHIADTRQIRDTWVTYCGSTERTSANERDPRGYNIVEFDDEVTITRRGLDTREFVFVDLELGEREGIDRVRERVREEDVTDAVVLVTLEGDGEPVTPASVEEFVADRGALVARVNDKREIETESADLDVSFADPDDAVKERVRQLGLSVAARNIEETVRSSKLADTNVRAAVEGQVEDLLDDDLASFEPAPGESSGETEDDESPSDDGSKTEPDGEPTSATDDAGASEATDDATDGQVSMEDFL
jgi:DNA repair exonuclease SbcCD nuclease subunit